MTKADHRLSNVAIRASAGSGKTYALSLRYLELLASETPPEEILAVTFTRKAAGEILARIIGRLADCVLCDTKRRGLAEDLKRRAISPAEVQRWFDAVTLHLDRLRIGTLDGFFAKTCRKNSLQLGLTPGWSIVEGADEIALRAAAIQDLIESGHPEHWVELSRLLSKGDVERAIHRQIDSTVKELYEVYTESLPEAWTAIRGGALLQDAELNEAIARIRGLSLSPALNKGWKTDLKNLELRDWDALVSQGLSKAIALGQDVFNRVAIPSDVVDAYQPLLEHVRGFFRQRAATQLQAARRVLEDFNVPFRRRQAKKGQYRFADVTAALLPGDGMDFEPIEHTPPIRHLLLDEFQDTSRVQWAALAELAGRCKNEGSFFCVGDPKQAIYRWRGGAAELFDILDERIGPLQWGDLSKSYRSSQVVLDVVHEVFSNLGNNPAMKQFGGVGETWSRSFPIHQASEQRPGFVQLRTAPMDDETEGVGVLRFAAQEIARLHQTHPSASIGVLTRTNDAMANVLHELRRLEVPASQEGGNPLSNSPAVSLVLSLFDWLDHPGDTASQFHVVHSVLGERLWGGVEVSPADWAARMRRELVQRGLAAVVRDLVMLLQPGLDEAEQDRLDQLLELAIQFEPRATLRPSDFVDFVEMTKVEDPRAAAVRVMTVHQAKGLEFDVVVLCELDGKLKGQPPPVVVGRPRPDQPINAVCRYVKEEVLPFFPQHIQAIFETHWEGVLRESLCLLYVAMTRARHALHMVIAPSKSNAKTVPGTYAGLLRCALVGDQPARPNIVLFESGNEVWYRDIKWAETAAASAPDSLPMIAGKTPDGQDRPASAFPLPKSECSDPGRATIRLVARTPSRLHTLGPGHWKRRFELEDSGSMDRGSILHFWYSRIGWLEEGVPCDADLRKALPPGVETPSDLTALLKDFRESLERPTIAEVFRRPQSPGLVSELWRERRFAVRLDDRLTVGIFDRVVLFRKNGVCERAVIVDFKTDRLKNAKAARTRVAVYEPQLQTYRAALASMLRIEPDRVEGQFVFVDIGVVVSGG